MFLAIRLQVLAAVVYPSDQEKPVALEDVVTNSAQPNAHVADLAIRERTDHPVVRVVRGV